MEDKSSESSKSKPEGSFEEHNRKCRGHIIRHLSEKLFEIYGNYESAKEIWFQLKKKYGGKDKANNQDVTTKWALFQINEDAPIIDQLHEYEAIVSKIQAEGIPMGDHLAALVLLNNLSQSWNEYRSNYLKHNKKKMVLHEVIFDIMVEGVYRNYMCNNSGGGYSFVCLVLHHRGIQSSPYKLL